MIYKGKCFKDIRIKTGEYYIVQMINEEKGKIIFRKEGDNWPFERGNIYPKNIIFNSFGGVYRIEELNDKEALAYLI
ncbi:MAG: hypothetical protein IMZ52_01570 [Actinobacteria bacterium]|nr:hypothetical protein [Actinomycetota bacterium]MBE3114829.1 hypothetical protein [Actinomycetota bacterium]